MIFYRLAVHRIVQYLGLDAFAFVIETKPQKKVKQVFRTKFQANQALTLLISIFMSLITVLLSLTIPFALLESPCEAFKEKELYTLYTIVKFLEEHQVFLDRLIITLVVMLIYIFWKMIVDGIRSTNIKMSPWVEKGLYGTIRPHTQQPDKSYYSLLF